MIPVVADPALIRKHVADFIEHGYVLFSGVYTPVQVEMFQELYDRAVTDWQFANGTDEHPGAVAGLLERCPREIFPAVAHPLLLGFALLRAELPGFGRVSRAQQRPPSVAPPWCRPVDLPPAE
jgi:hypothetical protein